ncbi:type II secretion system protein GspG [Deltaproteobacteria bacterium TL4]
MAGLKKGFSLMEITISLGVLSILLGTVAPLASKTQQAVDLRNAVAETGKIEKGLLYYFRDNGTFPITAQGLDALIIKSAIAPVPSNWKGPYVSGSVKDIEKDPWGTEYRYGAFAECSVQCAPATQCGSCSIVTKDNAYDLSKTQVTIIHSFGINRTDEGTSDCEAIATPCGDDLISRASSLNEKRDFQQDTIKRISLLRGIAFEASLINQGLYGLMDDATVELPNNCEDPGAGLEIVALKNAPTVVDTYSATDQWENYMMWHDQSQQFYSAGPDRNNDTCEASEISSKDIKGELQ